jgi:GNAT superfamily N-acetyltransferase
VHDDDLVIRPLTVRDAPAAADLLTQLGYPTSAESLSARITRMQSRSPSEAYVVCDDGGVVALASLHVLPLLTSDEPMAYLTSMVVAEKARGRGIGRRLVACVADAAVAHGCSRLTLSTHLRRSDAHAFYERVGFEHTGRRYVLQLRAER